MPKRMSEYELHQRFTIIVLTVVWLGCVYGLFVSIQSTQQFLDAALKARGVVVALNAGGSHPQVEFTNIKGEQISYPQGGFIFGYRVGDKVTVFYLDNSPNPQADRFGAVWESSIAFAFFVIGAPLMALGMLIQKKLRTRKASDKWKITD